MFTRKWLIVVIMLLISFWSYGQDNTSAYYDKTVKVALRDAGNKILLQAKDSTSLILPVKSLGDNRYELSFQNQLEIDPDNLVNIINSTLVAAKLSNHYIVEVIECSTKEVSYSYQIKRNKENSIVPCTGRKLPLDCYVIQILFMENSPALLTSKASVFLLIAIIFVLVFILFRKSKKGGINNTPENVITLGDYIFYFEQHLLKKGNAETTLTVKESELLKVFSQHPNQLIKRDRLLKEVWEDKGVFVGRSLDMFVSKLRKKFDNDTSIKIINVHGVGYRMEV